MGLGEGLALQIGDEPDGAPGYPTARLQRGMLLVDGAESLAEEGVGFGVPLLKQGVRTVFPGRMELDCRRDGPTWRVTATYDMDLVERLAKAPARDAAGGGGSGAGGDEPGERPVRSPTLYAAKDLLAALHRRFPLMRGPLAATSAALRRAFDWQTTYEETASCGAIAVTHVVRPGDGAAETRVAIAADLSGLTGSRITEVVVMNEQGARCFERYEDSEGVVLRGAEIGTWGEVGASRVALVSTGHRVAFSLDRVPGARLYRGRELVGARLAWAGFGYALPSARRSFEYDLTIARTA